MPAQTVIKLRRDTAANWDTTNPVLAAGEMGIETDTGLHKFGNGTAAWGALEYATSSKVSQQVKNTTGSSIPKGSVVYISGATGGDALITLADADTEGTSSKTLGLTATTIANDGYGMVVEQGLLVGVNTSTATAGQSVWLSSTAGQFVFGAPPAKPAHNVYLGVVLRVHATEGEILVKVQNGYEINELHDVNITGTLADNELLAWDDASQMWINQTADEAGLASLSGATFTGAINGTDLTLSGDLTVNGTTTNINTQNLVVEDKNIIIGDVATPTDTTADGGGITLKGATDKTFNWVDANDAWTSSEDINLAADKVYEINGTPVLSSTQVLGKSVPTGDIVGTSDSQTLANKTLTAPRFATAGEIDDANGNELIRFPATVSSAVNEVTVSNSATTVAPSIAATGDDTDISLNLVSKGTGTVQANGTPVVTTAGASFTGNISTTGTVRGTPAPPTTATTATNVGFLGMPQVLNPGGTLFADSSGKHVYRTSTGTVTIGSDANFAIGTTIVFISGSEATTTITSSDTLILAGTGTTGTRTLAANGMATAVKVASATWYISGNGLT